MAEMTHVVCSFCKKVNRVATARLGDHPSCGACKQLLFPGVPIPLDDGTFDHFIGRNEVSVVVDFWAGWCAPCKMMASAYESAAAKAESQAILAKLDTERAPRSASQFGIRSIPTLVLFKQGREVARQPGAMSEPQIMQWIRTHAG